VGNDVNETTVTRSKWIIILFLVGAVLLGALAYTGMSSTGKEHVAAIKQVIQSKGGQVQTIVVVPREESPFERSGKGNTIYKIDYLKNGKTLTAWYRADNHSSIMKEKEAWILPE
jgi:hypothetical protein